VAPDALGYVTYAHSFKPGGINLNGLPLDAQNQPITAVETVKPERVNDYELGLKTQLFGRKVTANMDAFWTDIRDYQATVTNSQENVIRGYLANVPQVRVRGVELDVAARPIENLNLYANGALTDARYVTFPDAPCPPELSGGQPATATNPASPPGTPGGFSPAFCNVSGQWLPGCLGGRFHTGWNTSGRCVGRVPLSASMGAIARNSPQTPHARFTPMWRAMRLRISAQGFVGPRAGKSTGGFAMRLTGTTSSFSPLSRGTPDWSWGSRGIRARTA